MTRPPVCFVSLTTTRPVVVLPEPDSPTSARISPRRIERSIPSTARTYPLARPRIVSNRPPRIGKWTSRPSRRRSSGASERSTAGSVSGAWAGTGRSALTAGAPLGDRRDRDRRRVGCRVQVAGDADAVGEPDLGRDDLAAHVHREGAAGGEPAAGRRVAQVGRLARDDVQGPAVRVDVGVRREQLLGVGVARRREDPGDGSLLSHLARVHHQHLVAGLGDDGQVVGDEHQGQAEVAAGAAPGAGGSAPGP